MFGRRRWVLIDCSTSVKCCFQSLFSLYLSFLQSTLGCMDVWKVLYKETLIWFDLELVSILGVCVCMCVCLPWCHLCWPPAVFSACTPPHRGWRLRAAPCTRTSCSRFPWWRSPRCKSPAPVPARHRHACGCSQHASWAARCSGTRSQSQTRRSWPCHNPPAAGRQGGFALALIQQNEILKRNSCFWKYNLFFFLDLLNLKSSGKKFPCGFERNQVAPMLRFLPI